MNETEAVLVDLIYEARFAPNRREPLVEALFAVRRANWHPSVIRVVGYDRHVTTWA